MPTWCPDTSLSCCVNVVSLPGPPDKQTNGLLLFVCPPERSTWEMCDLEVTTDRSHTHDWPYRLLDFEIESRPENTVGSDIEGKIKELLLSTPSRGYYVCQIGQGLIMFRTNLELPEAQITHSR